MMVTSSFILDLIVLGRKLRQQWVDNQPSKFSFHDAFLYILEDKVVVIVFVLSLISSLFIAPPFKIIVVSTASFYVALYVLHLRNYNYWKLRGVQYEKPFPVVGNLLNMFKKKEHMMETIHGIYKKYDKSPYVGMFLCDQPNLMIRSPELVKKILVKDFNKFVNRPFASNESVDPLMYHAIFSAKDTNWRNIRTKLTPVFSSGKIKLMFPLMQECTSHLVSYLEAHDDQVLNIKDVSKKYTVDIISSCAFGINANSLKREDSEIFDMAEKMFEPKSTLRKLAVLCYFAMPKIVNVFRFAFADKTATNYLLNVFNQTYKQRENNKIVRHDLIDLLNNLNKNQDIKDNFKFDENRMAAQAIMFFGAGNDTTSVIIAFTLYELALNSKIQDRLRQEIRQVQESEGSLNYENVSSMKYLSMVIGETLRKYTFFLQRETTSRYTFEETGLTIDKGACVLIPVVGLHYDPKYYPDPYRYDPERWSEGYRSKLVPYTYLPFGEGPRHCIGERFGVIVSKLAVATVINNFQVDRAKETPVPPIYVPDSVFVQIVGGLNVKITKI